MGGKTVDGFMPSEMPWAKRLIWIDQVARACGWQDRIVMRYAILRLRASFNAEANMAELIPT